MIHINGKIFLIIRLCLGGVFLFAAWYKILTPLQFAHSIENYQIVGQKLSYLSAIFIPALEIVIGILLISGVWLKEAFLLTLFLYFIFDVMISQAYFRGLDISCGCFNPSGTSPIGIAKFVENFVLTLMAAIGYLLSLKK